MILIRIISLLSIASLVIQVFALLGFSNRKKRDEDVPFDIECPENEFIRITEAKWQYKRTSLSNLLKPNIRFPAFFFGNYLGMGTWDVLWKVRRLCAGENNCSFTPSRDLFGDCGYKMHLTVSWHCIRNKKLSIMSLRSLGSSEKETKKEEK